MSVRRISVLACDAIGCDATFHCMAERADTTRMTAPGWAHRVWAQTKTQGVSPSFDFCPEHAHLVRADEPAAELLAACQARRAAAGKR